MKEGYEGLIIRNEVLIRRKWVPPVFKDEEDPNCMDVVKEGYYDEKDITDQLPYYLNETCIIDDNVTLRDFFKLLNKHKEFLSVVYLRDYFKEYLEYGLNCEPTEKPTDESVDRDPPFDYLRVYLTFTHEKESVAKNDHIVKNSVIKILGEEYTKPDDDVTETKLYSKGDIWEESTYLSFDFDGMSVPVTQEYIDANKNNCCVSKPGDRIPYGFFGSDLQTFIDYPLILDSDIAFCEEDFYGGNTVEERYKNQTFHNFTGFTLNNVIHAIFWELSFNGSPEQSKKVKDQIFESKHEIEEMIERGELDN